MGGLEGEGVYCMSMCIRGDLWSVYFYVCGDVCGYIYLLYDLHDLMNVPDIYIK